MCGFCTHESFKYRDVKNLQLVNTYSLEIKTLDSNIRKWNLPIACLTKNFQGLHKPSSEADSVTAGVATF